MTHPPFTPRRSTRVPSFSTNITIRNLFFCPSGAQRNNVKLLHSDPPIYLIEDFLSPKEYDYFDHLCTYYETSFQKSFTEDEQNGKVHWLLSCWQLFRLFQPREHQDLFISQRAKIRLRAMLNEKQLSLLVLPRFYFELITFSTGLSSTNVEPLQVISLILQLIYLRLYPILKDNILTSIMMPGPFSKMEVLNS